MTVLRVTVWPLVLGGLLLAVEAPVVRADTAPAAAVGAVQIKRPNLVVADLDRSLRIYRDILGFTVFGISESGEDSYSYPVFRFPREGKLRMATLSTETAVRTLALTELKGSPVPAATTPHRQAIVIEVKGIEQIAARLQEAGLALVPPKPSRTPEGREFVEQAFEDFDGHLIVLYELR